MVHINKQDILPSVKLLSTKIHCIHYTVEQTTVYCINCKSWASSSSRTFLQWCTRS